MANRQVSAPWRPLTEAIGTAIVVYVVAGTIEAGLIRAIRPSAFQLAWVSDVVLSAALGIAVYLWRHLLATRRALTERERAELVIRTQLSMAEEMQRRLLPSVPPAAGGLEWAAALASAGKIGGDFYDFVEPTPGIWFTLVADVSGKGIPAAMALGSLRSAFRELAFETHGPAALVGRLSAAIHHEWMGSPYVTCIVARLETERRTLTYTNAGHPAGVIVGMRTSRSLSRGGPPAGLLPHTQFEEETVDLRAGDVCLLVTDGVTEALENGDQPGLETIASRVRGDSASAGDICDAVMALALQGTGPRGVQGWDDDRTVVVVTVSDA